MSERLRVVFCATHTNPAPWVAELVQLLPEAEVVVWDAADPRQADYAVVWAPEPALFETQKNLRALFNLGAGVDGLMRIPGLPPDVPVVRLGDAGMSVQMAEYVCHAVIRFARELDQFEGSMRTDAQWVFRKPTLRSDYPVGVMGLGVIGARVAAALAGFEYPVFGWARSGKTIDGVTCFAGAEQLPAFLKECRILVCVLPLTPETEGILNRENMARLKPQGYVVNVARGAHLVDEDLLELLASGHLAGATLDVFREEPLPPSHAFWKHPKITLTPHISARTLRAYSLAQIAGKIRQHRLGQPVDGLVDISRGY